jgi:uncharacterized protein YhaN
MRIRQLDLLRYGHFTDESISMPANSPDIQIVLGDNEAGKSTAMAGIEDLLFGIPSNSLRNFVHDYGNMRVGATLEKAGQVLTVRRRKGKKDTLLSEEDVPIPSGEGAIAPYLAGADRGFYTRMFSLDHGRLREGGKELLQAHNDIGQMLFSASAGITDLRQDLMAMETEADTFWASRRAAHRKYFQAEERLKSAEAAMRDHIVTAGQWQLLKTAFEAADAAYQAIEREIEFRSAELRRLSRIRRVYRDVRKREETEAAIQALGLVTPFDDDAAQLLENSAKSDADAKLRVATLNEQVAALRAEQSTLVFDSAFLSRADDIQRLHDRRIQIHAGRADLPKRRAELAFAEATLTRLATELEWSGSVDQLVESIPPRAKVAKLRILLNRRGERNSAVESAKAAVAEAECELSAIALQVDALGPATDFSNLSAVIKAAREFGDIGGQIANSKREEQEVRSALERKLGSLRPAVAGHAALSSMPVPPLAAIEAHRDTRRNLDQQHLACLERIRFAEHELAGHKRAYEQLKADEHVVARDELEQLRSHRDAGWSIIRRRYVEGAVVQEAELSAFSADELPQAFEAAVRNADEAADRRFEKSKAAARLVVIAGQISEQNGLLETLTAEEKRILREHATLGAAWEALWADASLTLQDPDTMIEWWRARSEIVELSARLSTAERNTAFWQAREAEAKRLVLAEFDATGMPSASLSEQPLYVIIQSATAIERKYDSAAKTHADLETQKRKATEDVARKRKVLEKAQMAWADWMSEWDVALKALGLSATSTPETADAQINVIDEMREFAARINELRHGRIEKILRDIEAFEQDALILVQTIAPGLSMTDAEDAVLNLECRLVEATRIRDLAGTKQAAIESLCEKIDECHERCGEARKVIDRYKEVAGVETIDELRAAIHRSNQMQQLRAGFDRLTKALTADGDGLSIAALRDECAPFDLDNVTAKEQTVEEEVKQLRVRLMEAGENRNNSRREFEAIGADDRAARAASDRQAALAEMKRTAEEYVRLRSAIVLLRWAIDRYRREKQAPILKRASELFAILTDDSFQSLQLDFGENDRMELIGVRQGGERVNVAGMSDGSVDQLYLALRVAAIEDYLTHAEPLPFVADDLFINFDDKRAAAGFRILGELAKKTQVLFFTHHRHLVTVAREALGASVASIILKSARSSATSDTRSEAA